VNLSLEQYREGFKDENVRYAVAEDFLSAYIAAQIKELRGDRSQQEIADAIGTKQSGISRLENVNYSSWEVETLRKLARAFGVRLRISFEDFGTLLTEMDSFSKETLKRHSFKDDPIFNPKEISGPEKPTAAEPGEETPASKPPYPTTEEHSVVAPAAGLGLGGNLRDQEGLQQVLAAAMWQKPAGSTELGDFANPGVLISSGLLQSPMTKILSVSDSTTVSDSAAAQQEIMDAVKATSTPAPINTKQSVPQVSKPSRPKRIENPLGRKAKAA
jgi:transcriptional regulator with XRE-family HTH domain